MSGEEKSECRISNAECRISKEGILPIESSPREPPFEGLRVYRQDRSISIYSKARAQRFQPASFDTAELVAGCGSIFDILRFAVLTMCSSYEDKNRTLNIESSSGGQSVEGRKGRMSNTEYRMSKECILSILNKSKKD